LLFLVWTGASDDNRINILFSSDAKNFSGKWIDDHSASGTAPALAAAKRMHIGWASAGWGSEIHVATIRI